MYILPLLSGMVMVFAYPPYSVPLLPFVGLVPLFLFFSARRSARQTVIGGLLFCVPYFIGSIYWMFNLARFTSAGWIGAVGTLALHFSTFFLFPIALNVVQHRLRLPLFLTAPTIWTVSEHLRSYGDFYFPWVTLGYSLSGQPGVAQHADLIGVYGISWWLALINALLAVIISGTLRKRGMITVASILALSLILPMAYNYWRWRTVERSLESAERIKVAVVQPDIRQDLKWSTGARNQNLARLNRVIERAEKLMPELVIGPEACLPLILNGDDTKMPPVISSGEHPLLLGVVRGFEPIRESLPDGRQVMRFTRHLNSAVLLAPDREVIAFHDKQYLVPVTEQIPYKDVFGFFLPFMRKQFGRFDAADRLELISVPERVPAVRFGTLICYESLFPGLVRRMAVMGASFLVNITNDAWFGRSSMPYQHLGFSVLRAIETRRSVVRSANTGISALVDPLGRVIVETPIFEEKVFDVNIQLRDELTVYSRTGDIVAYLSYLVVVASLVLSARRR